MAQTCGSGSPISSQFNSYTSTHQMPVTTKNHQQPCLWYKLGFSSSYYNFFFFLVNSSYYNLVPSCGSYLVCLTMCTCKALQIYQVIMQFLTSTGDFVYARLTLYIISYNQDSRLNKATYSFFTLEITDIHE